jgi:hypothetical protein
MQFKKGIAIINSIGRIYVIIGAFPRMIGFPYIFYLSIKPYICLNFFYYNMTAISKGSTAGTSSGNDLLGGIEKWIEDKKWFFFSAFLVITAWFAYSHFDARMSFATDDAGYIARAYAFLKRGLYPGFQGPLYPLFLALMIKIFGLKFILLKSFSILFLILHIVFLWLAFHRRIPNLVLVSVCLFSALNPYILYYGSFTFSEAFMMFMQSLMFYMIFKQLDKMDQDNALKKTWTGWLLFGLMILLLSLTKNVGIVAIAAFTFYFLIRKEWKNALLSVVSFGIIKVVYEIIARGIFKAEAGGQLEGLMRKNYYDPSQGNEDLMGYVNRFFENFGNYISIHFYKIVGFGEQTMGLKPGQAAEKAEPSYFLSFLFLFMLGFSLYILFKKNKYVLITLFYAAGTLAITFITLQVSWNQDRLIVPYVPLVVLAFFSALYYWVVKKDNPLLKVGMIGIFVIISLMQFPATARITKQNSLALKKYRKGSTTYNFRQPIINFIEINEWIDTNLPEDSIKIATNKPEEAFVYARKAVFLRVPSMNGKTPEEILKYLKENHFTHILMEGFLGNKVASAFMPLYEKTPDKLEPLKQVGEGQDACYLFKIKY